MKHLIAYPEKIYADGGYYDREISIEDCFVVQHLNPSPVTFLDQVFRGGNCERTAYEFLGNNEEFKAHLSANYEHIRGEYKVAAACIAYSIENCYLYKNVIYRQAMEGLDVIHETYRSNDRPWTEALAFDQPPPPANKIFKQETSKYIYIGSVGSGNYGHWLVDDLARLKFLENKTGLYTLVLTSMGEAIDNIRVQSIELILNSFVGLEYVVEFTQPSDVLLFENLIYITPVSSHPLVKNKEAAHFVREATCALTSKISAEKTRLFVKRSDARYRKLTNMAAIEAIFTANGFISIDPEGYSFQEQVEVFSCASVVVGIMGAAMTNTMFCGPDSKIIYLAPEGWMEPFYWDLAGTMGHQYTAIFGALMGVHEKPFLDDFTIPENLIRAVLDENKMSC